MIEIETLAFALNQFADLTADEFNMSISFWHSKTYKKGDFFNQQKNICRYLGFISNGAFRSYIVDPKTDEEKNIFLYSKNQFVVPFKSFINQTPCDYQTQALTNASILYIHIDDLLSLYKQSHKWERFGRLLAEKAFNLTTERMESFVFKTLNRISFDHVGFVVERGASYMSASSDFTPIIIRDIKSASEIRDRGLWDKINGWKICFVNT